MEIGQLQDILSKIHTVHAGIIGDFCVDIYWDADMTKSELSKETPHFPLPITKETASPGAAGNVAANMAALKPASLSCIGICGKDWRGSLLTQALMEKGVQTSLIPVPDRFTNAYCKPMRHGISDTVYEDPRLDFENYAPLNKDTEELVLSRLENISSSLDVLAVSDQFRFGIVTPNVRQKLAEYAADGLKILVDSRHNIGKFQGMFLKPNESECAKAVGAGTTDDFESNARELAQKNNATVIETLGEKGALITDGQYLRRIPAVRTQGEIDICGAGDTSLSALTLSIGAGFNLLLCGEFAALASSVTIRKIGQTGTADEDELKKALIDAKAAG